jgi:transposase-like protein
MKKRRTFTAEFKAERVLEILTGEFMPAEVCRAHLLLPQQLSEWKTEFITNAPLVFQRDAESEMRAARVAELERHVGRLTLDLEASKKVSRLLSPAGHRNGRS